MLGRDAEAVGKGRPQIRFQMRRRQANAAHYNEKLGEKFSTARRPGLQIVMQPGAGGAVGKGRVVGAVGGDEIRLGARSAFADRGLFQGPV